MRAPIVIVLAAAVVPSGVAFGQIYRCENNGVIEYSNSPASATQRNCQRIELPELTTLPAPKPAPKPAAAQGATGAPAAASANFPRVDPAAQKNRDLDRRRILQDELRREEQRLAELRQEYNAGEPERRGDERNYQKYLDRVQRLKEDIARSEGNVESLRREMAAIRD
ncbi:MAG TPA: DUF4124 domain-containing protein [Burkholderiaceae bacterium]|nr:DUF4124 domain-containing protein [Burkholderiaceae bacterium]